MVCAWYDALEGTFNFCEVGGGVTRVVGGYVMGGDVLWNKCGFWGVRGVGIIINMRKIY